GIWAIVLDMLKVSDGTTFTTSIIDTTAVTMVEATAMTTDDQNRIFITGYSLDGIDKNIQTVAIDSNSNLLWVANHASNYHDVGNDIGIDDNGYVYVTGYSETGGGKSKAVTIKYEAATGDTIWVVN